MNWIKPYWKINIHDYNIMEKTGFISQYKEWYNPFPVKYFTKGIAKELKILAGKLNATFGGKEEMKKEALRWQLQSHNLINGIRNAFLGITTILDYGTRLTVLTENQTRRIKRKLKFKPGNLGIYIEKIKELTQIEIECLDDLGKVNEFLQYKVDKYNEMMRKQQKETSENVYLMSVVIPILEYLNQTVNVKLTVLEFIDFRNNAMEKSTKEKAVNGRN